MLSVILLSILMILIFQLWSGIWSVVSTWIGFWTWIWSSRHCGLRQEVACCFQCWKKLNWFCLTGLITLVLLMWKWMGLFLRKNNLLKRLGCLSFPSWIGALTLSLLLKLLPRKLVLLWSFFFLRLLCISINLPYNHAWSTVIMSGLVHLVATWNCWISYKNRYAGLLALHLLPLLKPWIIKM